jgi:pantoate--beta-alanine ligase
MPVPVSDTVEALRQQVDAWRRQGERVALVPTMGALHAGHLSLATIGRAEADRVVVSIFVNPTQFAPTEDFSKYPRTFEEDLRQLEGLADLVFAPPTEVMYPPGAATAVEVEGPATVGLEDRFRPTHFRGVATICAKLFIQAMPDIAVFGEKDYQQVKVVTRMACDLDLPLRIVPAPTVREPDGLAMSSRNRYLSPEHRAAAATLLAALQACAAAIRAQASIQQATGEAIGRLTDAGFSVDYLEARDAETLAMPESDRDSDNLRLLVAARIGSTRLIDNIPVARA